MNFGYGLNIGVVHRTSDFFNWGFTYKSEVKVDFEVRRDGTARLHPEGVFWFGSAPELQNVLNDLLVAYPEAKRIEIDLSGVAALDAGQAGAIVPPHLLITQPVFVQQLAIVADADRRQPLFRTVWPLRVSEAGLCFQVQTRSASCCQLASGTTA